MPAQSVQWRGGCSPKPHTTCYPVSYCTLHCIRVSRACGFAMLYYIASASGYACTPLNRHEGEEVVYPLPLAASDVQSRLPASLPARVTL